MIAWLLAALALAACVYAARRVFVGYPSTQQRFECISRREAGFLDCAAEAMFPSGGAIPLAGADANLPGFADRYLSVLHPRIRLQIRLLFFLFEHVTLFLPAPGRGGHRRFSALRLEQRVQVLQAWADASGLVRILVFTALRAVLTMGYLGHPRALRYLRLAPLDFESPVLEVDLLYPPIGKRPEDIRYTREDLSPASDGTPLDPFGPIHPGYRGEVS